MIKNPRLFDEPNYYVTNRTVPVDTRGKKRGQPSPLTQQQPPQNLLQIVHYGKLYKLKIKKWEPMIMDKAPEQLVEAVNAAKLTRKTVRQSFLGILAIKLIMLILSVFGITYQLWFAAMIDVVACVAGILYSARVWKE